MKTTVQIQQHQNLDTTQLGGSAHGTPANPVSQVASGVNYVQSSVSKLFTPMNDAAFDAFTRDIATRGQLEPILIRGHEIVDGWHRYRACIALNIEPRFEVVDASADVRALSISLNLQRRQLSTSQKAVVAARLTIEDSNGNFQSESAGESVRNAMTVGQAAVRFAVSERSVHLARRVLERGDVDLIDAVERDQVAVSVAAAIAKHEGGSDRSAALARALNKDEDAPIRAGQTKLLRRLSRPSVAKEQFASITSDSSDAFPDQHIVEPTLLALCERFERAADVLARAVSSFTMVAALDLAPTQERVERSISGLQRALRTPVSAHPVDSKP